MKTFYRRLIQGIAIVTVLGTILLLFQGLPLDRCANAATCIQILAVINQFLFLFGASTFPWELAGKLTLFSRSLAVFLGIVLVWGAVVIWTGIGLFRFRPLARKVFFALCVVKIVGFFIPPFSRDHLLNLLLISPGVPISFVYCVLMRWPVIREIFES